MKLDIVTDVSLRRQFRCCKSPAMNACDVASDHVRLQGKDYRILSKRLKKKCDGLFKDNETLSSRLVSLKYLIYKTERQRRRLQEKLEQLGVDYHAAAAVYSAANDSTALDKDDSDAVNVQQKVPSKPAKRSAPAKAADNLPHVKDTDTV